MAKVRVDFEGDLIKLEDVQLVTKVGTKVINGNTKMYNYFIQMHGTRHEKAYHDEKDAIKSRAAFVKLLK